MEANEAENKRWKTLGFITRFWITLKTSEMFKPFLPQVPDTHFLITHDKINVVPWKREKQIISVEPHFHLIAFFVHEINNFTVEWMKSWEHDDWNVGSWMVDNLINYPANCVVHLSIICSFDWHSTSISASLFNVQGIN